MDGWMDGWMESLEQLQERTVIDKQVPQRSLPTPTILSDSVKSAVKQSYPLSQKLNGKSLTQN